MRIKLANLLIVTNKTHNKNNNNKHKTKKNFQNLKINNNKKLIKKEIKVEVVNHFKESFPKPKLILIKFLSNNH